MLWKRINELDKIDYFFPQYDIRLLKGLFHDERIKWSFCNIWLFIKLRGIQTWLLNRWYRNLKITSIKYIQH
jgi:hypothetical protein